MIERYVTLACVSNEVGGDLIGNARWLGVPLKDLLDEAGPEPGADQVVSRSVDGWTCGTPTAVLRDGRDAMLAVGMNGEPLPVEHGFPVRMVVPGLYGYVSATQVAGRAGADHASPTSTRTGCRAAGRRRRRSRRSRASTRRATAASVPAGAVVVAGVAWAQHRGIAEVEVRVDDGAVAGGDAGRDGVDRHLAAVVVAVGRRRPGEHTPAGAGDRQRPARRRPSDTGAAGAGRRDRLAQRSSVTVE